MLISIADCNHGFWDPEIEECNKLSDLLKIPISIKYQNCNQDDLVSRCAGSDIIFVQRLLLNKENIQQIPTCKVVVRLGAGIDNINVKDMESIGVRVIYFPGFCTEEVANHSVALILSAYRNLPYIWKNKNILGDFWGKPYFVKDVRSAIKTTMGILGYGKIGRAVHNRLLSCGFNVLLCDPYVNNIASCSLEDLFTRSDIVTIHCSLTDETRNMVNYDVMSKMKKGGIIINVARGSIVNSSDLKRLLDEQSLQSAYVDVYDPEPIDSTVLSYDNLYITPHIAFYSWDSLEYLKRESVRQSVRTFLETNHNGII